MKNLTNGFWAGVIATGPMTLTLFRIFEALPRHEKKPLPPVMLVSEMSRTVGAEPRNRTKKEWLMMLSHFLYGGVTGAIYSQTVASMKGSPSIKGSLFGLGVWAGSYLGWIPMLGLKPSATDTSGSRNLMMISAHLVWGSTLAVAFDELNRSGRQMIGNK